MGDRIVRLHGKRLALADIGEQQLDNRRHIMVSVWLVVSELWMGSFWRVQIISRWSIGWSLVKLGVLAPS